MTILQKLHAIEKMCSIYSINYRRAGIAFTFYEGKEGDPMWRNSLTTYQYYRTFTKAVREEYKRLKNQKEKR